MLIPFTPIKVAQAAAVLLSMEPTRRMGRLRLLKLLYIADRESLIERARPITGDNAVATDNGPVLSQTYNLIKTENADVDWSRVLHSVGRDVQLREDPGVGKLSRYEITKLQEVATRFLNTDDWAVADYTHTFSEWTKNCPPRGSSRPIPLDDLLEATGLTADKEKLLEVERAEGAFQRLINNAKK